MRRTHQLTPLKGKGAVTKEAKDAMWVQVEQVDSIYASQLDADDANCVTLSNVTMLWSSGDGLTLKTIRLSLDAIAAWWIAKGQTIKAPKDGNAFWAVRVTF